MAVEKRRGCGYRKVGGLYLMGEYIPISCDRLPYPLEICPCCGHGIKVGRGMTAINPLKLFGIHENCIDENQYCFMCKPKDEIGYIMRVGEKYYPTPQDFLNEGITQGFSKRIAQIPRYFEIGKTVIYLAHINACIKPDGTKDEPSRLQDRMIDAEKVKRVTGIFSAFIPQRIEKLYWQSALDDMPAKEKAKLKKRGIIPIGIPDGDKDHK